MKNEKPKARISQMLQIQTEYRESVTNYLQKKLGKDKITDEDVYEFIENYEKYN